MIDDLRQRIGLIRKAPENFLTPEEIQGIKASSAVPIPAWSGPTLLCLPCNIPTGCSLARMTRTIPMELVESGEVIVAYGMNGEMIRPENGYPLRLVVPGVQGVSWVKWLRRVEVGDKPYGTKDEAVHYIDLMPDGTHRQYTSVQEVKSVITTPSGGQILLDKGFYNITGLAWSGRGKIVRVDAHGRSTTTTRSSRG